MLILEKKEEFLQQKVNYKKKVKTALIDYGSGNLQSAYKALELAGNYRKKNKIFITSKSKDLLDADKIVLPGVGTFSDCMNGLKSLPGMIDILNEILDTDLYLNHDKKQLQLLYDDLIKEQRNVNGKYFYKEAPSYGNNGFYSASVRAFQDFLIEKYRMKIFSDFKNYLSQFDL